MKLAANKNTFKTRLWLLISLVTFLAFIAFSNIGDVAGQSYADTTTEIVIKLAADVTIEQINQTYGTELIEELAGSNSIYLLLAPADVIVDDLLANMNADVRIEFAELNAINNAPEANGDQIGAWGDQIGAWPDDSTLTTTDSTQTTLPEYEWELGGDDIAHYINQTALSSVDVYNAWSVTYGDGVTVAVLDTGVDMDHPVLAHRLLAGYDFVDDDAIPEEEFNGLDDDRDGYVDEVAGHGTHIAGIVHLLAPDAMILPLRVLDSDGRGDSFVIAEAILYAAEQGAQVINLSLGTEVQSQFLNDVINQVAADGVLVVAAAGNLNANMEQYPAASTCAIAVTAVTSGKKKTEYASYGDWVTVAGPGQRIYSTFPGGQFAWWKGTSMATPFVSAEAALLLSEYPTLTLDQLALLIAGPTEAIRDRDYNDVLGTGRVNLGSSMAYLYNRLLPAWLDSPLAGCQTP